MKVQSQQPAAPAGPAPAAEAPQDTPSTSFSEVMARKHQPEGQAEPGMDQPPAGEPAPAAAPGGTQIPGGETPAVPYAASPGAEPRALPPEAPGLPAEIPFPRAAASPLAGGEALPEQPFHGEWVPPGEAARLPEFPAQPAPERSPLGEFAWPIPGQAAPIEKEKLPFPLPPGSNEPGAPFQVPGEAQKLPLEPGQMPAEGVPPGLEPAKPGRPQQAPRFGGIEARDTGKESGEVADEDLDLEELAEDQPAAPGTPAPVFPLKTEAPAAAQPVEAPRPLQDLQKIRALVQEVRLVSAPSGDKTQMDITLNSQTLDGLQIRIERDEGRMNIQFATRSDEVAQLLTRNMQNLQQSLAAHGLRVANLQVVNPMAQAQAAPQQFAIRTGEAARSESGRQDSSDREGRGGGQGHGQGQGQGQDGRRRGRQ